VRLSVEKFLDGTADQRCARGAADEDDFVHVGGLELCVGEGLLDGGHSAVNDRTNESIERASRKFVSEYATIRQSETKSGRLGFGELVLHVNERLRSSWAILRAGKNRFSAI